MAQTIAEKLAEKYDVTPSTTIAGTLKKITNDETGDVNIASLVSKMETGGSGDDGKVLVLNKEVDFKEKGAGDIYYSGGVDFDKPIPFWLDLENPPTVSIEIDEEEYISEKITHDPGSSSIVFYIGIQNPGDTSATSKVGAYFSGTNVGINRKILQNVSYLMINTDTIPSGVHQVKIYMEA